MQLTCVFLCKMMFACFFFGLSLYCVMFSFALIDCWDLQLTCVFLCKMMFACFFFGLSLYCVMFSFALIDCWDYFGFCLMTTNRNALLIAILEDNILLQWRWIYENHVCDLQIKKWKWKGFKSYLGISENIAWKN